MAQVMLLAALIAWSGVQARACPELEGRGRGRGGYTAKVDLAETRAGGDPEAFRARHPYALGWFPPGEALPFVLTSPRGVRLTEGEIAVLHEKLNDPEAGHGGAVVNYWFGGIDPREPPSANLAQTLGPEGLPIYRKLQRFLQATLRGARPAVLAGLRERLNFWREVPWR